MLKRILANLGVSLCGIVVALLVMELVLRVAGISFPRFHIWDNELGVSLRPGASDWYGREGGAWVTINSQGLHDKEHTFDKPPDTIRIAALGDSFTEGLFLPIDKLYWSVMGDRLASCPALQGKKVEVMNFGTGGYGTGQELIVLRSRVWQYHPDIVTLEFFSMNDISDNYRPLAQDNQKPYFIHKNGQLVLDDSFKTDPAFLVHQRWNQQLWDWVLTKSRVAQLTQELGRLNSNLRRGLYEEGELAEVYREPTDPDWQEAWSVTEDLLVTMKNEVTAHGAKFLLVTISNPIQVNPDRVEREAFMKQIGVENLWYPDDRIKSLADRAGIDLLQLGRPFQEYADQHHVYLHGFGKKLGTGHWNEEGNRLGGEMIAQKLCSDLQGG